MTLWRTTYRDRQDKAANKDHDTEAEALRHAQALVNAGTVTAIGLVYVYAVEVEGS